jgi:two-component system sporulation sensor kinase B
MPMGGNISIRVLQDRKHVRVQITDTGVGIAKQNLTHVFEPFYSTKRLFNNYGLGLSYCYNVVLDLKGQIDIHSEESVGTTVSIVLPRAI